MKVVPNLRSVLQKLQLSSPAGRAVPSDFKQKDGEITLAITLASAVASDTVLSLSHILAPKIQKIQAIQAIHAHPRPWYIRAVLCSIARCNCDSPQSGRWDPSRWQDQQDPRSHHDPFGASHDWIPSSGRPQLPKDSPRLRPSYRLKR